jgi:hypothetical protein
MMDLRSTPLSNSDITSFIYLVKMEAMTAVGKETFCLLPTALNSNLFPVNANGLVLLRSVLSCQKVVNPGINFPKSLI